jgi:hypothetical protein
MLPAAKCQDMLGKQRLCSIDCATAWGLKAAEKSRKVKQVNQDRQARERLKSRTDHAREAQAAFNAWVRYRDRDNRCISCQRFHAGQVHAGHYRTTKAAPGLRFNLLNVHAQCQPCNTHMSGNIVEYRINLVKRIGSDRVQWLESQNEPRRFEVDYLKRVKRIFAKRLKIHKSFSHNQ